MPIRLWLWALKTTHIAVSKRCAWVQAAHPPNTTALIEPPPSSCASVALPTAPPADSWCAALLAMASPEEKAVRAASRSRVRAFPSASSSGAASPCCAMASWGGCGRAGRDLAWCGGRGGGAVQRA
eukprot:6207517-Pleurochrysis_carterae.AAC.3